VTSKFSIDIRWDWSEESLILDVDSPPEIGQKFSTSETWHEDDNLLVTYTARVVDYTTTGTKHQLRLKYALQDNPSLKIHNLCWGTSLIKFDTEKLKCTATWRSSPPDNRYDGVAPGRIRKLSGKEAIEYEAHVRIKRKQQKFKSALVKHTKTCELTGESAQCTLDAAHITNVRDHGNYSADNGLLLRTDLHRLFDANLLKISATDGRVSISKSVPKDSKYRDLVKGMKLSDASLERVRSSLKKRRQEG
jgi:putative restriction endonuclease